MTRLGRVIQVSSLIRLLPSGKNFFFFFFLCVLISISFQYSIGVSIWDNHY